MDSQSFDPSALSFTEKKTLFSAISGADHGTPLGGRLINNTSSAPSSFRRQLENQYPKFLTASVTDRIRLTPAKLFGDASGAGTEFRRFDRQQSHKLILEAATQTDSFSQAATVVTQLSNPLDSPDEFAVFWIPKTGSREISQDRPIPTKSIANGAGNRATADNRALGTEQAEGPYTPLRLITDLLSQSIADCKQKGLPTDPRVAKALCAAKMLDTYIAAGPTARVASTHPAMEGPAAKFTDAATSMSPSMPLLADQPSNSAALSAGLYEVEHRIAECSAGCGTAAGTTGGLEEASSVCLSNHDERVDAAIEHPANNKRESSGYLSSVEALQAQALELRLQLQQRALAQYDANRTSAMALRRSLLQLQAIEAAAAASLTTTATTRKPSPGFGQSASAAATSAAAVAIAAAVPAAGPVPEAMAAAATPADGSLVQQLLLERSLRVELAAKCTRLQRQCNGLLSYISLLSGKARVLVKDDNAQVVQLDRLGGQPEMPPPGTERVRVRLVLLPAESVSKGSACGGGMLGKGAWNALRGVRERSQYETEEEDSVEEEEEETDIVRVKVHLTVCRSRVGNVQEQQQGGSEQQLLTSNTAAWLLMPACSTAEPGLLQQSMLPVAEALCGGVWAAGIQAASVLHEGVAQEAATSPVIIEAACTNQGDQGVWNGPQQCMNGGQASEAGGGLAAAVRRLLETVEEEAAIATAGPSTATHVTPHVSHSLLEGLRGLLRQLRGGGAFATTFTTFDSDIADTAIVPSLASPKRTRNAQHDLTCNSPGNATLASSGLKRHHQHGQEETDKRQQVPAESQAEQTEVSSGSGIPEGTEGGSLRRLHCAEDPHVLCMDGDLHEQLRQQQVDQATAPKQDAVVAMWSKAEALISASEAALADVPLPAQHQTEAEKVMVAEVHMDKGSTLAAGWARRTWSVPPCSVGSGAGDQPMYDTCGNYYEGGPAPSALVTDAAARGSSSACDGAAPTRPYVGSRRMHERIPTPPCSPRTSLCTPLASIDEDDSNLGSSYTRLGSTTAAALIGDGINGSGCGGECYSDQECGFRADWYDNEEMDLDLADVDADELAVAAALNGPAALLSAVGVMREQLLQAHLEIVKLSTQMVALSHQREGLRAQASQRDAALQLVAMNEGDALLEAEKLRSQLASERAARARLSVECEELKKMISVCLRDAPSHHNHEPHAHGQSRHFGSLRRFSHGPHHNHHQHQHGCDAQLLQQLLLQHKEQQHQRGLLLQRHRSAPRHRPTGACSVRGGLESGILMGSHGLGGLPAVAGG